MRFIREHIIFRCVWLVLALHIVNCSVDTPDPHPENVPEDLSYNDMESVVEIVLEQVLGIENALAETDDTDTNGNNSLNFKKGVDFFYHQFASNPLFFHSSFSVCKHTLYEEKYSEQFHPELISPPPKA